MRERRVEIEILEKIVDRTNQSVSSYLIALSVTVGVNMLITSQFLLAGRYPFYLSFAFIVAPFYLLLLPFKCIMEISRASRKFYEAYQKILVEEAVEKSLKDAQQCTKLSQRWWWWAISALTLYWGLSFMLVTLQMVILW